jgi:hypothetical protein
MRRAVLVCDEYFLDIFLVLCRIPRQIDWIYHNAGLIEIGSQAGIEVVRSIRGEGYQYLADICKLDEARTISVKSQDDAAGMVLWYPVENEHILIGTSPANPPTKRQSFILRRRYTAETAFISVFHPYRSHPEITSVTWSEHSLLETGTLQFCVHLSNRNDKWLITCGSAADPTAPLMQLSEYRLTYSFGTLFEGLSR